VLDRRLSVGEAIYYILQVFVDRRLCIAARALVDVTQEDLAREAHVGVNTIRNFEAGEPVHINHCLAIREALQRMGVRFVRCADGRDAIRRASNHGGDGLV